ncbi:hypothetical protein FKM82_020065 [Ascaphus truei]
MHVYTLVCIYFICNVNETHSFNLNALTRTHSLATHTHLHSRSRTQFSVVSAIISGCNRTVDSYSALLFTAACSLSRGGRGC